MGQGHGHLGKRDAAAVGRFLLRAARPVEAEPDAVGVGHVVGEQRVRDEHDGRGAAVRGGLEGDADILALGEPADHEQAEPVGVGQLELRCLREPQVGVEQRVGGHAEAPVVDLQGEAVGDALADDLDGGVRRGEHRGVLQQFGHQVGEVGDGRTGDGDAREPADLDALVVLDLGDGGTDDVHELDGLAPLPGGGGAGEDDQALGVRRIRVVRWSRRNRSASSSVSSVRRSIASSRVSCLCSSTWLRRARLTNTSETPTRSSACLTAASTAARWRVLRAWPTSPISFLSYPGAAPRSPRRPVRPRRGGASRWAAAPRRPRGPPGAAV